MPESMPARIGDRRASDAASLQAADRTRDALVLVKDQRISGHGIFRMQFRERCRTAELRADDVAIRNDANDYRPVERRFGDHHRADIICNMSRATSTSAVLGDAVIAPLVDI